MRNTSLTSNSLKPNPQPPPPAEALQAATHARDANANAPCRSHNQESRRPLHNSHPEARTTLPPHDISPANSARLFGPARPFPHARDRRVDAEPSPALEDPHRHRHLHRSESTIDRRASAATHGSARRPAEKHSASRVPDQTPGPRASGTETLPA